MSNPTFIWHVTMAVHEDRVRTLQQSRRRPACTRKNPAHRPLDLYRRLVCRLQRAPSRLVRSTP